MRKFTPYLYNIIIFSFVFISFLWTFRIAPFGPESLLTIDMGQQYIDFFSLYKEAITSDSSLFLYSFQKGLGGEMIGIWTYYLMSPINLILLFFKSEDLYLAVILMTYLKLMLASLSFHFFASHKHQLPIPLTIGFSIAFAFMSYNLVYLLNIMWLDGIILLPVIAYGLESLLYQGRSRLYFLSLSLALIVNYYIGFMISLFLILYATYLLFDKPESMIWKNKLSAYGHFIWTSFLAAGLASIVLIPAAKALWQSKGQHFELDYTWKGQYSPLALFSKLFIGAFSFNEIKIGPPNLFVSGLVTVLVLAYFLSCKIDWKAKLISLGIFIIFGLSFYFEPLNLLWHGGQNPIWYPYRYSFNLSFFSLVLSLKLLDPAENNLSKKTGLLATGLHCLIIFIYLSQLDKFTYLSIIKLTISLLFTITYGLILLIKKRPNRRLQLLSLALLVTEAFSNINFIMAEFSYVDVNRFVDYVQTLDQAIEGLRHGPDKFYRIDKSFMRTKNEAFFSHYHGLDHFSSTLEAKVIDLYAYLGQPSGSGYAAYTNPNLFLDDFFNVRYHLAPNPAYSYPSKFPGYKIQPDTNTYDYLSYPLIDFQDRYQVFENRNRLGLAMEVSKKIGQSDQAFQAFQPIQNLEYLLSILDPDYQDQSYFTHIDLEQASYDNIKVTDKGDGDFFTYQKINNNKHGSIQYAWTFDTDQSYYLTLPSQYDNNRLSFSYDGSPLQLYTPFKGRQILGLGIDQAGTDHQFKINIKRDRFKANLPELYRFDRHRYDRLISRLAKNQFQVESFHHDHITGKIDIDRDQAYLLFTIPYDPAWKIKLDDKPIKARPVLNHSLMAIPLAKGSHQIELSYRPKEVIFAIITSISASLIYYLYNRRLRMKFAT